MKKKIYLFFIFISIIFAGCDVVNKESKLKNQGNELLRTIENINQSRENKLSDAEGEEYDFNEWLKEQEGVFSKEEIDEFIEFNYRFNNGNGVLNYEVSDYDEKKVVSRKEAEEDVEYLFKILKYGYGAYEYFGGDEVFLKSKQKILDRIKNDSLSAKEVSDRIADNLQFIRDAHLSISGNEFRNYDSRKLETYLITDTKFLKDGKKYYKKEKLSDIEKRKFISKINGKEEIEKYMKLTIDKDGSLVYTVGELKTLNDKYSEIKIEYNNDSKNIENEYLKIDRIHGVNGEAFEYTEKSGITYIRLSRLYHLDRDDDTLNRFIESGKKASEEKVVILDLRGNLGGFEDSALRWVENYLGVSSDIRGREFLSNGEPMSAFYNRDIKKSTFDNKTYGVNNIKKNKNRFLFVLIDKMVVSAGEWFVENLMGIDNVILIGTNTKGCIRTSDIGKYQLRNSKINIDLGNRVYFPCIDEYEDFKGIEPDIIVNDNLIVEKTIKLIKHYDIQ